jgi:hypothetical protein
MGVPENNVDWTQDVYWRNKRLSPAQLQVHDIRLEGWNPQTAEHHHPQPMLEVNPVLVSSLLPALVNRDRLAQTLDVEELTSNRQEQASLKTLVDEYGWMNCLRSKGVQKSLGEPEDFSKVRWM